MRTIATASLSLLLMTSTVDASLISTLSGQAYYDDTLNVTWLTDANLASTNTFGVTGINTNGTMDLATATAWIGAVNSANYLGFNDWRLPETSPIDGTSFDSIPTFDGSTDVSYNLSAPGSAFPGALGSELGHLFHSTLGNDSFFTVSGALSGCSGPILCLTNSGPFSNMNAFYYWSGTIVEPDPTQGIFLHFGTGQQAVNPVTNEYFAWAVRSGSSSPVPIPAAPGLFALGLGMLFSRIKNRKIK